MPVPHMLLVFLLLSAVFLSGSSHGCLGSSGSAASFLLPPFVSQTQTLGAPLRAPQRTLGAPLHGLNLFAPYRRCCWQSAPPGGFSPRRGCLRGGPPLRASYKGGGPQAVDAEEYLRLRNTVTNLSDFQAGQELLQQQEEQLQQQQLALKGQDAAETYQRVRRAQRTQAATCLQLRIAEADLQQKARQARAFLESRHQVSAHVKVTLQLRGRERLSPENHLPLLTKLQQLLQDVAHAAPPQLPASPCSVLALSLQPRRKQNKERNTDSSSSSSSRGS
ncbi:hypothetical protein Emed_002869 [Eimeria media]